MNDHLESLGRLRRQAVLLLAGVFTIGALAGAAFEHARDRHRHGGPPRGGGPHGLPPHLVERLDLSPDQERRIGAILERQRKMTDAVLDQYLPRLRALTDSLRVEVRAELTPQQQAVFDELEKERPPRPPHGERGYGGDGPDRGPPGGPPPR